MSILSDKQITRLCVPPGYPLTPPGFKGMIEPFEPQQVRSRPVPVAEMQKLNAQELRVQRSGATSNAAKVISYGLSSYGYDVRCSSEFKIFTNVNSTVVDPKDFDDKNFVDMNADDSGGFVIIPPNSFALARSLEHFRIPRDILVICLGKSTYARCGIIVNVTPLNPEWEGYVTLEFSNTSPLPAKIYAHEGCAQMVFFRGDEPCEVSYADRDGKYQGQVGVTLPKA